MTSLSKCFSSVETSNDAAGHPHTADFGTDDFERASDGRNQVGEFGIGEQPAHVSVGGNG